MFIKHLIGNNDRVTAAVDVTCRRGEIAGTRRYLDIRWIDDNCLRLQLIIRCNININSTAVKCVLKSVTTLRIANNDLNIRVDAV
jgi:hypothetical protein